MLEIILDCLGPEAERIIFEEQVGFRPGRGTTEQIFNLGILCERCLQCRRGLCRVCIDFRKAFDRVWHAALWATMRLYSINTGLINSIQNLYDKATSAVCFNGSIGGCFRTTVGVRQGCLLSPTLFNIFLERVMADALGDHESTVVVGGGAVSGLRFAGVMDGLAGSELGLAGLVEHLDGTSATCVVRIGTGGTRLMAGGAGGIGGDIGVAGGGVHAWGMLWDCLDRGGTHRARGHLGRRGHGPRLRGRTDVLPGRFRIFIFL